MDIKQEIVDAAAIVAESIVNKTTSRIYFGVVTAIGENHKCMVKINNTDFTIQYYGGEAPSVNGKYPVFAPANNLGLAFIITTGSGGGQGTSDYNQLSNRPSINSNVLSGNKTAGDLGLFDGNYNNLTNKPSIPTKTSDITNDSGFINSIPSEYVTEDELATVAITGDYLDLSNKPTIPTQLSQLSSDSTHRLVTDVEKSTWNNKQNVINDLADIRAGAFAGATAVQPNDLATVATSGNYADLSSKPTIPTKTSELTNDSGYITAGQAPVVSVNGKTGAVSLSSSDVGADASGTAVGLIGALDFSSPTASGDAVAFIDTVSQNDGQLTATKKNVRTATTSRTGIVQLNNTVTSTSTTQAATANAVKQAYDNGGVQSVNGQTGNVVLPDVEGNVTFLSATQPSAANSGDVWYKII